MELGNALFGNSRGVWSVPRNDKYSGPLKMLWGMLDDTQPGGWEYGDGFANDVFEMRAYYWGECTCGYEQVASEWSESNDHRFDCYQTIRNEALAEAAREVGYTPPSGLLDAFYVDTEEVAPGVTGMTLTPRHDQDDAYDEYEKRERQITRALCEEMGLDPEFGAAVHCTCDHQERWAAFCEENDHGPRCPVVLPNFHHKPSDLRLDWYKYPLRDSYMSRKVAPKEWRAIIRECMASLSTLDSESEEGS